MMSETNTYNVIDALIIGHTINMIGGGLSNSNWRNQKWYHQGGKACPEREVRNK